MARIYLATEENQNTIINNQTSIKNNQTTIKNDQNTLKSGQESIKNTQNEIKNLLNRPSSVVKSVQRGTCDVTNGSTGKIATINNVDLSKSILLTTGDMGRAGNVVLKTDGVYIEGTYSPVQGVIFWQVIEFY